MMNYSIQVYDRESGRVAMYSFGPDIHWDDDKDVFWLSEGNFACDCNRCLAFKEFEVGDMECNCGDNRFMILRAIGDDGAVLYDDPYLNPIGLRSLHRELLERIPAA